MLGLGLAASYTHAMYRDPSEWKKIHDWLAGGAPQPLELAEETDAVIEEQAQRVTADLGKLRAELDAYSPSAMIVLVSDTGRLFSRAQVPQFSTFLGASLWGSTRIAGIGETAGNDIVELPCDPELAAFVHEELVGRDFDMSYSKEMNPLGEPEFGMPASLVTLVGALNPAQLKAPAV